MNINPVNIASRVWARAHESTSQAAINSRVMREVLRWVVVGSMMMIAVTLWQTFGFIKTGKVDVVTGTLLGGIFTFFGGILAVAIPALVTALRASDQGVKPTLPPPTVVPPASDDSA